MSKAAKLVIAILFVLLAGSVFVVLSTLSQKVSLEQAKKSAEDQLAQSESRELKALTENKKIGTDLQTSEDAKTKLEKDVTDLNAQLATLNGQVTELSTDRDDWKSRVDAVKKERDDLMAKLEQAQTPSPPTVAPIPSAASNVSANTSPNPAALTTTLSGLQAPAVANPVSGAVAVAIAPDQNEGYWAGILKQKAGLELQIEDLKKKLSDQNISAEELKKKNSDLEIELSSLRSDKDEIERKIKYGEDLSNNLSIELARAKNDRKFMNNHLDQSLAENVALRSQIKTLTETKMSLEKGIAKVSEDKYNVEKKLDETENVIQAKIDEVWEIKDSLDKRFKEAKVSNEVELAPIVVSAPSPAVIAEPGPNPGGPSGLEGKVVSINDDNNFVIVDLGEKAGIQLGDALNVYRGAKFIAGLEIIQVRKDICAADIKQKSDKIKVGDTVR